MSWKLHLLICLLQILLYTNAMENIFKSLNIGYIKATAIHADSFLVKTSTSEDLVLNSGETAIAYFCVLIANKDDTIELFLSIQLPFSVKRGEVINVPVSVHNPLYYKIHVTITLENSKAEYEFMDFDDTVIDEPEVTKSIKLERHSEATISFLIRPIVIGNVTLKFRASTFNNRDTIYKTLNVVPKGITQFVADAFLVNLKKEPEKNTEIVLESITNLIPGTLHFEVGVVGDIMGLVLKNLDSLVRIPKGPVEQTMSSLLPNYLIMKYLKNSNHLTPNVEARLRQNLETAYQKILNCRHMDGSFSGFGPSGAGENLQNDTTWMTAHVSCFLPNFKESFNSSSSGSSLSEKKSLSGSTFLTSYVLRFLPHLKEFINVNETVIEEGLAYLSKQQIDNGAFTEKGDYLLPSQRNHVTLTGAALLAFLENDAYADKYIQNINKGLEFMGNNVEIYKLLHIHALATYAFKQAQHAASQKTNLIKWLSETNIDNQSKWWQYEYLSNVEIISYNLVKLPAIKQLIAQRKGLGGFESTQDTVIGLIDIIKFAEVADYEPAKMDISITLTDKIETIKLTEDNRNLYKSVELPPETKSLKITSKGNGSALEQLAFQYNTFKDQKYLKPSFTIVTIMLNRTMDSHLSMIVCVTYVGEEESSNMALLEIYTPSGYVVDDESLKEISKINKIANIELKNSGTLMVIYFDQMCKNFATCLTLEASRNYDVAMQKPVPIIMYDYNKEDRRAVAFYDVDVNLCDICGSQEECSKCK